ncbi:MAG: hypothetical protein QOE34_1594 [Verrucomicrobiota bacterium]|jgi:hypothetical protein
MNLKPLPLLLAIGLPLRLWAADDLPKAFGFDRYQAMMDRSPFAVATAVAAPVVEASFAKDLYVANAARSNNGDLVTVASSADKNFKKYLTTGVPVDGFSISNIEWSEKVGATKVTIAKDGQFATITFNQALLSQPAAAGQNPVPQPQQYVQPQTGPGMTAPNPMPATNAAPPMNFPRPMPVPSLPQPPARVRGVIPRSPNAPAAPVNPNSTPTPEL